MTYGALTSTHGFSLLDGDSYGFSPGELVTALRIHTRRDGSREWPAGLSFITTHSGGQYRGVGDTSASTIPRDATPCPDSANSAVRLAYFRGLDSRGYLGGVVAVTAVWTTYTRPPSPPQPPPSPAPSPPSPPPSPPAACMSLRMGPYGELGGPGDMWDDEGVYRRQGHVTR